MAAVVYGTVGAVGAAAWASATPLISAYASASSVDRPHLAATFATVLHIATALWHDVAGLAAAVWFASVAIAARDQWRGFARYSAVLAAATGLGSIGAALNPDATSTFPGPLLFLPLAVWPAWLATRILRESHSSAPSDTRGQA